MPAIKSSRPYGCHSLPPVPPTIVVQDGWTADGRRRMVEIPNFVAGCVCRYEGRGGDPRCLGCRDQNMDAGAAA